LLRRKAWIDWEMSAECNTCRTRSAIVRNLIE
jgi:hypothetical protein